MPRFKSMVSSVDTEDALKRNKLVFNATIDKFIAMAYGLPPSPDTYYKSSPTAHPRKHCASRGRITKTKTVLTSNSLRSVSKLVPYSPSSSIEDDIVQEVEESLQRRKEELGLGDDYVLQEMVEDDREWHGAGKKEGAHNILTASQRSRKSLSGLRKQNKECHGDSVSDLGTTAKELKSVNDNKLPRKRGRKKKELNSLRKQNMILSTRKSSSESPKNRYRKKLEDLTNNEKHRTLGQTKSPKKRVRKKKKDMDNDHKLRSSSECKTPRKRGRKRKESFNSDSKPTPNKSPKKRDKTKMKDLDNDGKLSSSDKSKTPRKRGRKRKEKLNSDISLMSNDENKSPKEKSRRRSKESPNTKKSQPARRKTLTKQVNPAPNTTVKMRKSSKQHKDQIQPQTIENNTETTWNRQLTEEGQVEEIEQECSEINDAIKNLVQQNVGSNARIIHMVREGENVLCFLDICDILYFTISGEDTELEQQTIKVHANKEKKSETELERQTVRRPTEEDEINTPLQLCAVRVHTNREKKTKTKLEPQTVRRYPDEEETDAPLEQQTVRVHTNKEKKIESQKQTSRMHTNLEKEANTEKAQALRMHTSKEKETETEQQTAIRCASNKEPEQTVTTHVNEGKRTDTGKHLIITAHANKNIDTQQQEKQETTKKTKRLSKADSKVSKNTPAKRKVRTAVTESSNPQKVLLPVPVANRRRSLRKSSQTLSTDSKSHDSPEETSIKLVTHPSVCGRVPEAANSVKDATPSPPPQQDHSQSDLQESKRSSLSADLKTNLSNSKADSIDHSVNDAGAVVHNGSMSNSPPGLPCQTTRENLQRKRKFELFREPESEEDSEWSTNSIEDDTIKELNVVKKRKRSSLPYRLPGLKNKRKPSKSSHTADDDDDEGIMLLTSSMPIPVNEENDPSVVNNVKEKHNQSNSSQSYPKKPTPVKGHVLEKRATGGHHRSFTNRSFSQSFANSFIARLQQGKMMAGAASVQSREEDLDVGDTWTLLTSEVGTSLQGSQVMETTSFRHQDTTVTTTTTTASIPTSSNSRMATTANNTTATSTTATKVSKPTKNFWSIDSDEEVENGSLTTGLLSRSTNQSTVFTSYSQSLTEKSSQLPDYNTLGPERWMAAVKALQKNRKTSYLRLPLL